MLRQVRGLCQTITWKGGEIKTPCIHKSIYTAAVNIEVILLIHLCKALNLLCPQFFFVFILMAFLHLVSYIMYFIMYFFWLFLGEAMIRYIEECIWLGGLDGNRQGKWMLNEFCLRLNIRWEVRWKLFSLLI